MIISILSVSIFALTRDFKWYYDAAVGRFPIIIMGIICYLITEKNIFMKGTGLFGVGFLVSILLCRANMCHTYVLLYMIAPLCILLLGEFLKISNKFRIVKDIISLVGKYSLEIYVANVIVCFYRKSSGSIFVDHGVYISALLYIFLNTLLAYLMVYFNSWMKKICVR